MAKQLKGKTESKPAKPGTVKAVLQKKIGRPPINWEEVEPKILELVSSSAKGLEKICKENSDIPGASSIRARMAENKLFLEAYTRAKEEQADVIADEIMDIADDIAGKVVSHELIGAKRLQIDARKWIAAKLKPKKYGDKTDITTNGKDITPKRITFISADNLTDEQIEKLMDRNAVDNDEGT